MSVGEAFDFLARDSSNHHPEHRSNATCDANGRKQASKQERKTGRKEGRKERRKEGRKV